MARRDWERLLSDPSMPDKPKERLEWYRTKPDGPFDGWAGTMLQVLTHAEAALRSRQRTLEALAEQDAPGAKLRALGEADMAVLSLYLAGRAAQVYCDGTDSGSPIGYPPLKQIVGTLRQMRDCVMHWDEKADWQPAFLSVTNLDLLVVGTVGKRGGPSVPAGLPWDTFENWATRFARWADVVLVEDLGLPGDPYDGLRRPDGGGGQD